MIIKYLIDNLLTPEITALDFADKYASIVRTLNIAVEDQSERGKIKRYPVACDVLNGDCSNVGVYNDLVPDDTKKSVLYWEMLQPMSNAGQTKINDFYTKRFKGSARLVVWLNLTKLGLTDCDGAILTIPILNKILTKKLKLLSGPFSGSHVWIEPKNYVKQDISAIFGGYDYPKLKNYYLYPFDFYAIDVNFTIEQCLIKGGTFPSLPAIDCENTGAGFLQCKSIDLDGVNEYIANGVYPSPDPANSNFLFNNNESFSLSIWFKLDSVLGTQTPILGMGNSSLQLGYFITVLSSTGRIRFNIVSGIFTTVTGQFFIDSFDNININEWVNVICTYDGSQDINGAKIYVNGVDNGATRTVTGTGLNDNITYPTTPLKVFKGRASGVANGQVNNARVWRGAELSPAEALQEYNEGKPQFTAVQFDKLVLDLDIQNANYTGLQYEINNKTELTGPFTAYNSEETDIINDCPGQ